MFAQWNVSVCSWGLLFLRMQIQIGSGPTLVLLGVQYPTSSVCGLNSHLEFLPCCYCMYNNCLEPPSWLLQAVTSGMGSESHGLIQLLPCLWGGVCDCMDEKRVHEKLVRKGSLAAFVARESFNQLAPYISQCNQHISQCGWACAVCVELGWDFQL